MVTSISSGKRHSWTMPSMLMQLPTPEDCISNAPRWPPSQAPESSATPSSSVVSSTVVISSSAMLRSIRTLWPASGT
jgi:hypothetical protein